MDARSGPTGCSRVGRTTSGWLLRDGRVFPIGRRLGGILQRWTIRAEGGRVGGGTQAHSKTSWGATGGGEGTGRTTGLQWSSGGRPGGIQGSASHFRFVQ